MDYERIEKKAQQGNGGAGLSPAKLRNMILRVEKKRNQQEEEEEEELESTFSLRSQVSEIYDYGGSPSENCKDVDVVSVHPECTTSTRGDSLASEMIRDHRLKDHSLVNPRIRSQDESSSDYESGSGSDSMSISSSMFEFQKAARAPQRVPVAPFSKPAPSKWDDAQKWIASPTNNLPKNGHGGHGVGPRKSSNFWHGSRQPPMKVVVEVLDQKLVPYEEPDTKQIDSSQAKKGNEGQKFVSWEADSYPIADSCVNLSRHDSSVSIHSATTFIPPPSTARSVSMRDMGTEMTPIASQEPSRTGTPVRSTTPMRSPNSSRPSTPGRAAPASSPSDPPNVRLGSDQKELPEKEILMKTRKEIMVLGTQLGKMNIAAWASKEEENKDASSSLTAVKAEEPAKSVIETRAAAWEEAEKAKYLARFKREEMKIQAWENHQKAITEAEMRKIEGFVGISGLT
ncbi:unnamed protein product [Ilex paraguariensis]|uniref:Remorin C-terminal domain-containing protein n=1 Tax=Ilex paraguariensis TaxID=185542 RepID=A0ABC8RIE7_9AQUA